MTKTVSDAEARVWRAIGAYSTAIARPDADMAPQRELADAVAALANHPREIRPEATPAVVEAWNTAMTFAVELCTKVRARSSGSNEYAEGAQACGDAIAQYLSASRALIEELVTERRRVVRAQPNG